MNHAPDSQPFCKGPAWTEAEAMGLDMAEIEASIRRTVAERIERHDSILSNLELLVHTCTQKQVELFFNARLGLKKLHRP
jgi:hypothetical protein